MTAELTVTNPSACRAGVYDAALRGGAPSVTMRDWRLTLRMVTNQDPAPHALGTAWPIAIFQNPTTTPIAMGGTGIWEHRMGEIPAGGSATVGYTTTLDAKIPGTGNPTSSLGTSGILMQVNLK